MNIDAERGKVTANATANVTVDPMADRGTEADEASGNDAAVPRELSIPVAVQGERRPPVSRWAAPSLVPIGVTPGAPPLEDGAVLREADGIETVHLGNAAIVLHRRETEGVLANLQSPHPVLYVVLRPDDGARLGARLHLVTASDHEAQDHTDAGDDRVERVPMPPALHAPIEAFVAAHHAEEPHYKRKRRGDRPEERRFGREPLWTLPDEARPRDAIRGAEPDRGGSGDRTGEQTGERTGGTPDTGGLGRGDRRT